MEELKIYLDEAKTKEISDEVEFNKILAGKKTLAEIYIFNNVDFNMNVDLSVEGEHVAISQTVKELNPKQLKKVVFEFTPTMTVTKPIRAKLKIKLDYTIR